MKKFQEAGADLGELHKYYQQLLGAKSVLRSQRKEIKSYFKINGMM